MIGFFIGLADPWRGFALLLRRPSLWPFAALPFLLTLVVHIIVLWGTWHFASGWINGLFPEKGAVWAILAWILTLIAWLAVLWLAALAFIPLAILIAGPFNDLLSERTERIHRGIVVDQPFSLGQMLRSAKTNLGASLMRSLTLALLLVFALCFNIIPVIGNLMAMMLALYFSARLLSLEFTSYSMDRRAYTWRQRREHMRRHRGRTLGLGAMASLLMLTPLLSAAFIPASAVAGTLLFCETEMER